MFGPPKEGIFLTTFYGLYFHYTYKLQFFMLRRGNMCNDDGIDEKRFFYVIEEKDPNVPS